MGAHKYSQTQKIAILMLALGEDIAGELMRQFPQRDMQRIGRALASLRRVDQATVDGVLDEFSQTLLAGKAPHLSGGAESTKRILAKALKDDGRLAQSLGLDTSAALPALEDMDARVLGDYLQKEKPQTIALVLAHLEPQKFKETMKRLPQELHSEILLRVAKLDPVDPEVLADLNQALEDELRRRGNAAPGYEVGGPEKVAKLLNALDDDMSRALLDNLTDLDAKLSEKIREHLFTYEDLVRINDEGIRLILQKCDRKDLLLALKLTSDALKEKFFSNMSQRAKDMLSDDLSNQPKALRTDVEAAQKKLANLALGLRENGDITFADENEFV